MDRPSKPKYSDSITPLANICEESQTSWGGSWTTQKLDVFEKYVKAYLTIMNSYRDKYDWKLIYFDGFAGSGSRTKEESKEEVAVMSNLFEDTSLSENEVNPYRGAAARVLGIERVMRGFYYYYFVDKKQESIDSLSSKIASIESKGKKVFRCGDANDKIAAMADFLRKNQKYKALVFLDPFGMQIDWNSIKKLAHLSVDLWILIPSGVIVNRLLERNVDWNIGLKHMSKLKDFFGIDNEDEIRNFFYEEKKSNTLFGLEASIEKKSKPIERIAELYIKKLKDGIFDYVSDKPLVLYSNNNVPLFHFAFASQNKNAYKIAQQIINKR